MDWGSIADWVGAIGGILAVIAAIVSWRTSEKVVKLENKRDKEREIVAERWQAEHVTVVGILRPSFQSPECYAIMVVNGSDAPIYDIRIESQKADKSAANHPLELTILPPGRFVIPADPHYKWGAVIDQDVAQESVTVFAKGDGGEMITHVAFTDASSRKWHLVKGRLLQPANSDTE